MKEIISLNVTFAQGICNTKFEEKDNFRRDVATVHERKKQFNAKFGQMDDLNNM